MSCRQCGTEHRVSRETGVCDGCAQLDLAPVSSRPRPDHERPKAALFLIAPDGRLRPMFGDREHDR